MDRKKILVIYKNDNKIDELIQSLSHYPFDVLTASAGMQGLELAKEEQPDLILATVNLDDIDGFDLCWMIRQTPELVTTPYLLISDSNNAEVRINAYRSGVDAFLDSKLSIREVYTLIETITKRIQQIKDSVKIQTKSLSGKISHFSVVEILQMLNMAHKSGTLTFVSKNKKGRIGFWEGNILWAELDKFAGEDAIKQMVLWEKGNFVFEKDLILPTKNVKTSTMQIILDCCQLLDEKNGHS